MMPHISCRARHFSLACLIFALSLFCFADFAWAQFSDKIDELPPVVVKTVPPCGAKNVDAKKVKVIEVTFSKEMKDKNWSVVQVSNATFPKIAGNPSFRPDGKTCVIPVALQPGTSYILWFNQGRFQSFQSTDEIPAQPYLLYFQTKEE